MNRNTGDGRTTWQGCIPNPVNKWDFNLPTSASVSKKNPDFWLPSTVWYHDMFHFQVTLLEVLKEGYGFSQPCLYSDVTFRLTFRTICRDTAWPGSWNMITGPQGIFTNFPKGKSRKTTATDLHCLIKSNFPKKKIGMRFFWPTPFTCQFQNSIENAHSFAAVLNDMVAQNFWDENLG